MSDWDESKVNRVPAGNSAGGQFTNKAGGYEAHWSLDLDDPEKEMFLNAFEGDARLYLEKATYWEEEGLAPPVMCLFRDGEPLAYHQTGPNDPNKFEIDDYMSVGYDYSMLGKNPYMVFFLGSAGPGGGTAALVDAMRDALMPSHAATGLYLESAKSAVGFYEKMGMHRIGRSYKYYYTEAEMRLILEEWDATR